jgi:hypothetical protein
VSVSDRLAEKRKRIRNEGISWNGTFFGLMVEVNGTDEKWVLHTKSNPDRYLLEALEDPKRWISAHVLLTLRHDSKWTGYTAALWNGLEVILHADGRVEIDENQRPAIRQYWIEKLGSLEGGPSLRGFGGHA